MIINQKHTSKGMYEVNRVKVRGSLDKPYYVKQAVILFLVCYALLGVTMAVQHLTIYTDVVNQTYTINGSDDAIIHEDEPSDSACYTSIQEPSQLTRLLIGMTILSFVEMVEQFIGRYGVITKLRNN